jgi:sporulation protein YlmC with PRC-barrel domain
VTGRERDLGLHLLDRQVVDTDGRLVCKVDDVELTVPDDGGAPYVSAILCGPQALAPRLGGLLGSWLLLWARTVGRAHTDDPGRIGMELVTDIGTQLTVARSRADLGVHANEDRARDYLVSRLPGAGRAGE